MYLHSQALVPHSGTALSEMRSLALEKLYGREREVAALIYERGLLTAVQVQQSLSARLANPTVRATLNRLVSKGVLTRFQCGSQRALVYGPALNQFSARELELRQFADDFFAGSLGALAEAVAELFSEERAN